MDKNEFEALFGRNIKLALTKASAFLGRPLPDLYEIELHGAGVRGDTVSFDKAMELIYLGETIFYRVIDIAVKQVKSDRCKVFVRISDHPPSSFGETWNMPEGNGPFKVLDPVKIDVEG